MDEEFELKESALALFELTDLDEASISGMDEIGRSRFLEGVRIRQPKIAQLEDAQLLAALGVARLQIDDVPTAARLLGEYTRHENATARSIRVARKMLADEARIVDPRLRRSRRELAANLLKAELSKPDGFAASEELIGVAESLIPEEAGRSFFGPLPGATYLPDNFYLNLLHNFKKVVKIYSADPYRPLGSGFFVKASDVLENEDDRPVILTCHHVVFPPSGEVKFASLGAECQYESDLRISRFKSALKSSGGELDYCVLDPIISSGQPSSFFVDEQVIPDPLGPDEAQSAPRIVQLGHPDGGSLSASNAANRMIAKDRSSLHYGANPMPGMSGGPVCDLNFNVVSLHLGSGAIPNPLSPHTSPYFAGHGTRLSAIKNHPGD